MPDAFRIKTLKVTGFRAYLLPQTFDFSQKSCLALYGPNACGKSSLVDSIEFYLSEDGTLERLGTRTINNFAGPLALKHNLAEEKGVPSEVAMSFGAGSATISGVRSTSGRRTISPDASEIRTTLAVDPIIRGYALRGFVESQSPEHRYSSVATWLNLGPLVEVQKNIRALRQQVKSAVESTLMLDRFDESVSRATGGALAKWDEAAVLAHANLALQSLDNSLCLNELEERDPALAVLTTRAADEANRLGLSALKLQRKLARALHSAPVATPTGEENDSATLMDAFAHALALRKRAEEEEVLERGKAEKAIFAKVWEAAQPLFAMDGQAPETCPICDTPVVDTKAGSAAGISQHLVEHLQALAAYRTAKTQLESAKTSAKSVYQELLAGVQALIAQDPPAPLGEQLKSYFGKLRKGPEPSADDESNLREALAAFAAQLDEDIEAIETRQGEATYGKAVALVQRLIELNGQRRQAEREREELQALASELNVQASLITTDIREAVQSLLDTLNAPMNLLYQHIQGAKARPVRLQLPPEEEANQQRLFLLVDFANNREGVQPGGYLSDSQIHSLALAFRLAAILNFNTGARFAIFDDVVTSYDADHRRTLASLVAENLGDLQIVLATHDERFFHYLRDQLPSKRWRFSRILRLDPDFGPRLSDVQVGDAVIQARWDMGLSAANEMRQAEEEWLLSICRDFGVSIQIRPLDRPYSYERSELATALARFLKDRKLIPPLVPGVSNPFLQSLVVGSIENFGSHFQDNPNAVGSLGDEQARWKEFTSFRDLFQCQSCSRRRFTRGPLHKPVCANENCESQFGFTVLPAAMAS